jgi:hypothetical protein
VSLDDSSAADPMEVKGYAGSSGKDGLPKAAAGWNAGPWPSSSTPHPRPWPSRRDGRRERRAVEAAGAALTVIVARSRSATELRTLRRALEQELGGVK